MIDFTDIDADDVEVGAADAHDVPHQGHRSASAASRATIWKAAPRSAGAAKSLKET